MNAVINEIRQELDALILADKEKRAALQEKISAARDAQTAAMIDAAEAYKRAKVERYHKAQEAQRAATDAIEMQSARLAEMEAAPLITPEEYQERIQTIEAEQAATYKAAYMKISKLIDKAAEICDKMQEDITAGDNCMKLLQVDCYKDPDYMNAPEGVKVYKLKHWHAQDVQQFAAFLRESEFYKNTNKFAI